MSDNSPLTHKTGAVPCLLSTWQAIETELYYWLIKQTEDESLASDLLQETFLKALQLKQAFCAIDNKKAWFYRVAHNLLVDSKRREDKYADLDITKIDIICEIEERPTIDKLSQCLPKALDKLSEQDRIIITQCDLCGCSQQQFAQQHHITLSATKSRIQRARSRLRVILLKQCHIRFDEHHQVCSFHPN